MQKAVAEDYCADCKKFMADIKAIITDPTEEVRSKKRKIILYNGEICDLSNM